MFGTSRPFFGMANKIDVSKTKKHPVLCLCNQVAERPDCWVVKAYPAGQVNGETPKGDVLQWFKRSKKTPDHLSEAVGQWEKWTFQIELWDSEMDSAESKLKDLFVWWHHAHFDQPFYKRNLEFWQDWFSRGVSEPLGFTSKLGLLLLSGILNLPGNCELFGMRSLRDHCLFNWEWGRARTKCPKPSNILLDSGG